MKFYIAVAILYMMAGNDSNRYACSETIEVLLIEDARNEAVLDNSEIDDVLNTRRKRLANTIDDNDGTRPISFDPVVPKEPVPEAPPVDHGSTQVGLNCVDKDGGCSSNDGRRPVSFDVIKPQQPLPVPPPVEHGSSQAGLDDKGTDKQTNEEHGGSQGKVSTPGVSTTESSTTKQVLKDQKTAPGSAHVIHPTSPYSAPMLVLITILLIYYCTHGLI